MVWSELCFEGFDNTVFDFLFFFLNLLCFILFCSFLYSFSIDLFSYLNCLSKLAHISWHNLVMMEFAGCISEIMLLDYWLLYTKLVLLLLKLKRIKLMTERWLLYLNFLSQVSDKRDSLVFPKIMWKFVRWRWTFC